ncbi:hypothetical protein ACFLU5_04935 [Bacteroidota bacterium]
MKKRIQFSYVIYLSLLLFSCQNSNTGRVDTGAITVQEKMLARADSLEVDTPYHHPVIGDPLSFHASGFAKILCSAVFITGLDFEFAAENIGYFTAPYEIRSSLADRVLDMENKAVHIALPNGVVRTAKYYDDQGCICLPEGKDEFYFEPVDVKSALPDPNTMPWPMGDILHENNIPEGVNMELVKQAIDVAFSNPEGLTAAYVATYKG